MKAQKVVSVILALTLMMSMVPAAFAVELENPNDIFQKNILHMSRKKTEIHMMWMKTFLLHTNLILYSS